MGYGNVRVTGDYEGLYYIDYDYFRNNKENCPDELCENFELFKQTFINDFQDKFKSFLVCNQPVSSTSFYSCKNAIMENELFYIVIEDNEWSIAVELIQKECDDFNIKNLQKGLYKKYLEGIKNCLFNQFDELGIYCRSWTSGRINKYNIKQKVAS